MNYKKMWAEMRETCEDILKTNAEDAALFASEEAYGSALEAFHSADCARWALEMIEYFEKGEDKDEK